MDQDKVFDTKEDRVDICKKTNTVIPEWSVNSKTLQLEKLQFIRETGKQKNISCHIVQDDSGFIMVLFEGG